MFHKVFTERPDNEQRIIGLPGKDVAERERETSDKLLLYIYGIYKLQMYGWIKKSYYPIWCSSHWMFYDTIFLQQVRPFQSQLQVDDVFVPEITFTESLFHSNMYLMVFPSSLHQEWPTYSSHWTEALSSVARTKKLRIRAPKFPLLQLLMATPLQMLEVDSSNSFPSELNKQQQMFKGTARKTIVYRHNEKKSVYNHNW